MLCSSSLIEFGVVVELAIDQLYLFKIKFEKNYFNLNRIDQWIIEQEKSFSWNDLSENLFFHKLTKFLNKDLTSEEKNSNGLESNKETWTYIQSDLKNTQIKDKNVKNENSNKISLGNSLILVLKSMDLFDDYTFITSLEKKSYLELVILIYLLKDLKTEILNRGSYELFCNNLIILKLQNSLINEIVNDLRNNSKNVRLLKRNINFAKNDTKNEIKKLNSTNRNVVSIKSRLLFKSKILDGYCKKWKANNYVEIQKTKEIELKKIQKSIENIKSSIQIENQAHGLMMLAIKKEIDSTLNKMDKLEDLYNSSIEKIQIKLYKLKNTFELQKEKFKNLKEDFDYKQNILLNYNKEKNEDDKINEALKVISNWWLSVQQRIRRIKSK